MKRLKWVGMIAGVGLAVLGAWWFVPGSTPPITDSRGRVVPGSIAALEKVKLGGTEQWVLIRGRDASRPVLLFLHGGPGASEMAVLRGAARGLEDHFVVVSWDQRGAGKSFAALEPRSAMTVGQMVSDALELTDWLRARFHQPKIFLAGHSWGSALSVMCVQRRPDAYRAYIGIGQVVNMRENERLSYAWTLAQAEQAGDRKAAARLKAIGPPPYTGDWLGKLITQRRYLGRFGGEAYQRRYGAVPLFLNALFKSSEYTLPDKLNYFRGVAATLGLLWPQVLQIDFFTQAPSLQVPVYFMLGRHDYQTPQPLAAEYFRRLRAPRKTLIWFENSAHLPNLEEPEKFNRILIERVLPENSQP